MKYKHVFDSPLHLEKLTYNVRRESPQNNIILKLYPKVLIQFM